MQLRKVISGGQTGADTAGLIAARRLKIPTGGWAPKGWLTEIGSRPVLKKYGLREHESDKYPPRTAANVKDADATLLITHDTKLSGGSALTRDLCFRMVKPVFGLTRRDMDEDSLDEVVHWLQSRLPNCVLNIAGSRESRSPGIQKQAIKFLTDLFGELI